MAGLQASVERSLHRSRVRLRVLLMLSSLGEAFPRQLAAACRIDSSRLREVMLGGSEDYRTDLSLVDLGLARVEETPRGRVYAITSRGRRKARQLTARQRRRDERRRGAEASRPHPRPGNSSGPPVPTPGAPPSFSWSLPG